MSSASTNKILFLSDLHLGGFSEQRNEELTAIFFDVLSYLEKESVQLVILGDLLDYYMQYGSSIPPHAKPIFARIRQYNLRSPQKIIYVTGNHDNWDDGYLSEIGCTTIHEYKILTVDGKRIMLAHGDGLSDENMKFNRPLFHRLLRNSYFITFFKSITTMPLGNWMMKLFSRFNRFLSNDNYIKPNRIDDWAYRILESDKADVVICGHHHHLLISETEFGTYINTGAFFKQYCCAFYTNSQFQIVRWDVDKMNFNVIPRTELTIT
jgi:UDP-2,3-diacylglucosamine pyrophosphatase LpxH